MKNKNKYKHKNGKEYFIVNYAKIQENGEWVDAVCYKAFDSNLLFVRSEVNWEKSFKLVEK